MSDTESTVDTAFLELTVGRERVNRNPKRQGNKLAQSLSCRKHSERVQLVPPGDKSVVLPGGMARSSLSAGLTGKLTREG